MDSSITAPRFPRTHLAAGVATTLVGMFVTGTMITREIGYYDFGFAPRTMQVAMGASAVFWVFLLWDIWVEKAPGSRGILVLVPLVASTAVSWAVFVWQPLTIAAIVANFILWVILFARYIYPKQH